MQPAVVAEPVARARLARTTLRVTVGGALLLAACALAAGRLESWRAAAAASAGALPVWLWLCAALRRRLGDNVPVAGPAELGPRLGAATTITLVRGWLVSAVAGFLFLPPHAPWIWLPGPVYALAAILDSVDGAVARSYGRPTRLGVDLDVTTDAAGLLAAPLVAMHWQRLPPWYLLLAFAYPLFRAGLKLRERLGLPTFRERLRADPRARFFAGVQMTCVATALFPVFPAWLLWPAATIVMLPTLVLFAGEWRLVTRPLPDALGSLLKEPGS